MAKIKSYILMMLSPPLRESVTTRKSKQPPTSFLDEIDFHIYFFLAITLYLYYLN